MGDIFLFLDFIPELETLSLRIYLNAVLLYDGLYRFSNKLLRSTTEFWYHNIVYFFAMFRL